MKRWMLAVLLATGSVSSLAQCVTRIEPIASGDARDVQTLAPLKEHEFIIYATPLKDGARLEVVSVHDDSSSGGHMERGIRVVLDSRVLAEESIVDLTEFHEEVAKGDPDNFPNSYRALSTAMICNPSTTFAAVAFHWFGDITSPELLMTATKVGDRYVMSALPTINSGIFEIDRSDAKSIRAWTNLFEGKCHTCPTRYRIDDYVMLDGVAHHVRRRVPRHRYSPLDSRFPEDAARFKP